MPKPSAPDPKRSELLRLARAVADGEEALPRSAGSARALNGLRVIAALSQQLNNLHADALAARPARAAQFQWGHLDVIEPLGSGTSADVFRAYDPLLDVDVALKLSRPNLGRRATAEWISEARRLARLRHPNVVAVHGVDVHDGRAGLWLELVDGETLADYGERCAPLTARELSLIGIELCRGLGAIHAAGMLHRDIKPANLLRDRSGRILITDFGAAGSAALAGQRINQRGTPLTMAPELIEGGGATVASDLYSLGVVLYWLAMRRLPLVADDLEDLRRLHRQRAMASMPLELDGQPETLAGLIESLLAPTAAARPADAHEVERALGQALEDIAGSQAQVAQAQAFTRTVGVDFERIVARDAELTWLQQAQRRAMLGHAHPILLCGDSGTGKTALVRRFGESLRASGGRLLHVALSGYPPGRRRLGTLLARSIDPGRTDSSGNVEQRPAGETLRRLAAETPVLALCLDDLEHADGGEQEQILNLIAELRDSTVLVVCVLKSEKRPDAGAVAKLFGDEPHDLLMLEPFSPPQTEHAVNVLLGAPDYENNLSADAISTLHRLSGGNPFFLTELLRHLIASGELTVDHGQRHCRLRSLPATLPTNLEFAALERCRTLPVHTRQLLEAAAVVGERFRASTLTELLPEMAARIDEGIMPALRAGLLEPLSPGLFRFRHGLIQRALYDAIPTDTRRNLHRACVALLEREKRPEAQAWLSLHAERAGDLATAFAAGYRALTNARLPEMSSLQHCERLLQLADAGVRVTAGQRLEIELRRIQALCTAGQLREAGNLAERLDGSHKRRPASTADFRIRQTCAYVMFALGDHAGTVAHLEPLFGYDAASPTQRGMMDEVRLLSVRARAALGDYRAAELLMSVALLDPPRDARLRLESQTLLGWCIALQGRLREADEILDRALRLTREAEPALRADVLRRIHWVKLCRGRYQQAYALALAAHGDYRSAGNAMGQSKMSMAMGQARLMQGLPEEALGYLNRTALRLEDIGDRHCEAETLWLLGRAYTELDRLDDADAHIERALELIAQIGDRDDEFRFLIERARLRLVQKQLHSALDDAARARDIARELDSLDGVAFAEVEMAAAHFEIGDAQQALSLCEPAGQALRKLGFGEHWRADSLIGRCRQTLAAPAEMVAAAFASARDAIERTIAELDPSDQPRRERIRRARAAALGV